MAYYDTASKYGNYRFVTLKDIINNFNMMYVGRTVLLLTRNFYSIRFIKKKANAEPNGRWQL